MGGAWLCSVSQGDLFNTSIVHYCEVMKGDQTCDGVVFKVMLDAH